MAYYGPSFGYPPSQYQPTVGTPSFGVQPTYMPQQPQPGIKKVNGPQSALQFPVQPNSQSDALFDMNGKVFYIVTADAAGSKTLESFDYSPHVDKAPAQVNGDNFVSRQEYEQFTSKVESDLEALNELLRPVPAGTTGAATGKAQGKYGDA